jgi:hypothetical protein
MSKRSADRHVKPYTLQPDDPGIRTLGVKESGTFFGAAERCAAHLADLTRVHGEGGRFNIAVKQGCRPSATFRRAEYSSGCSSALGWVSSGGRNG